MATASRQLFSFARDQGVPFHTFFEKVNAMLAINSKKHLTRLIAGSTRLGHTPERHSYHDSIRCPSHKHIFRLHHCLQSAHCPWHYRSIVFVHDVHWVHRLATYSRSPTLEKLFFAWKIWARHQYSESTLLDACFHHGSLSSSKGSDATRHELEYCHLCRCYGVEWGLLLGERKA